MPTHLTAYRIFIASPGGLNDIRNCFRSVIEKYNTEDAVRRGVLFIPVGWEHTIGGVGRPQSIINKELEECDALFLVLHDRWGSDPGAPDGSTSGTQEEFNLAMRLLEDRSRSMREISVFFRTVEPARLSDPGAQLSAVISFKKSLEEKKHLLFQQFDDINEFEGALRMFLASWVRQHENESIDGEEAQATAPGATDTKTAMPALMTAPQLAADSNEDPAPAPGSQLEAAAKLVEAGRYTEAETLYARLTSANDDASAALAYGEFLFRLGRKIQAEGLLRRSVEIAEGAGIDAAIAQGQAALGRLLASRGDYHAGTAALQEAESRYEACAMPRDLASVRLHLGEILAQQGSIAEASAKFDQALLALSEDYSEDIGADIFAAIGQLNRDLGHSEAAVENYKKAIEIKSRIRATKDIAHFYAGYGNALESQGKLYEARAQYETSLGLFSEAGNNAGIADISDHLGHIYEQLGLPKEAEDAFDRSASVFEIIQNFDAAVDAYTSLGKLQSEQGRVQDATSSFRQALALVTRIKNKEEVTEIYERLGRLVEGDAGTERPHEVGSDGDGAA
ncbi:MAG TPA: tetratricopeptide repeat protein [Allosphingosinicella sp.]|nr:tetratricopeptide repeat protein [Allosphingosinicella sp.]